MRYVKVLIIAIILFIAMVFFFQNQAPLSQEMELNLQLYFIPPLKSMPLPLYFIVICAFFLGCLFSLWMLFWDRLTIGAKSMKKQWKINNLEKKNEQLEEEVNHLKTELSDNAKDFAKTEQELAVSMKKDENSADKGEH